MKSKLLILILSILFFSCIKEEKEQPYIKEGYGTVWLSGGLYFCAQQVHLNNGDTLIVVNESEIYNYQSGDKISLRYRETGNKNSGCNIGIDCEVIEIKKTD